MFSHSHEFLLVIETRLVLEVIVGLGVFQGKVVWSRLLLENAKASLASTVYDIH